MIQKSRSHKKFDKCDAKNKNNSIFLKKSQVKERKKEKTWDKISLTNTPRTNIPNG